MFALSKVLWFLATPSNALPALALLGAFTARARSGRLLCIGSLIAILALGLGPVGTWLLRPLEDRFPAYEERGQPIDGAIVLGGAVVPNLSAGRGQLVSGDAAERVIAMADLARRYPAARIVFSGGSGALVGEDRPEAEILLRFASTLGIDPARITVEDRSRTTAENAAQTRELVHPAPGERWLLVTSAWHMPRAFGTFRHAGFDVVAYPVDYRTGSPGENGRPEPSVAAGLERVDLATREWLGLLAYRLAGRSDALFPKP